MRWVRAHELRDLGCYSLAATAVLCSSVGGWAGRRCGKPPAGRSGGAAIMALILPVQCFLAREALEWSVTELARAAEVSRKTVERFERGGSLKATTVEAIQRALENAGVVFIDANDGGPGARLRKGD
jgi:DNA-binding Xre family transcriptional regulator